MPTIAIKRDVLYEKLGQKMSDEEFDVLCFQFGIELDEVFVDPADTKGIVQYKIDIPANRYDLLCIEGLVRSLLIFSGKIEPPIYKAIKPTGDKIQTIVKSSTKGVRPYVVTAVLRNVSLDQIAYDSLIELQEKLHHNICRKRSLVAIGVHDLDTLSPPFVYSAEPQASICFKPLKEDKEFKLDDLLVFYQNSPHLKHFLHLTKDEPLHPVIRDSTGIVLSVPPIINGDHSKVSMDTKNIFIECTATDLTKAKIVLDILVTMMGEHAKVKFVAEETTVAYEETGEVQNYPTLEYRKEVLDVKEVNDFIGIQITPDEMAKGLSRMTLNTKVTSGNNLEVEIPPTRHDVIHACDIMEDVAIAYGYDNIEMSLPKTVTIAEQFPLNKLTDQLRESLAQSGFTEGLTFSLCSVDDECEKIRHPRAEKEPTLARISNPKTLEFQAARQSLLPGLLKTIQANKKMPLPLKLFEISDVVVLDESLDTGARNERRLCAMNYNKAPGFEVIHGLLDRIMQLVEIPFHPIQGYCLRATEDPTYFEGRCAEIVCKGKVIGKLGVLHPEVLENFELNLLGAGIEISVEHFL